MTRRDEHTSPLGMIILARAEALGARRGPGIPPRPLSLAEMSTLAGGQLTRAAINDWILGRVKRPTPTLLAALASALASDVDYPKMALLNDMRAAVGMPQEAEIRPVDTEGLSEAEVDLLRAVADRMRTSRQEGAAAAYHATDRATRFVDSARRSLAAVEDGYDRVDGDRAGDDRAAGDAVGASH